MIAIAIILILISVFLLIKAWNFYKEASNQKREAEAIVVEKNNLAEAKIAERESILKEIQYLELERKRILQEIEQQTKIMESNLSASKSQWDAAIKLYKENYNYAAEQYEYHMEKAYNQIEKDFDSKMLSLDKQKENIEAEIAKLQAALTAGVEAQLREREKEENIDFYKLHITDQELSDIKTLNAVKAMLFNPVILSKLIWTTYFQKQTTELCNRVLGVNKICGIYKITNLLTQQYYIGQSVDVAQRWKDHTKCGLGIEAPATNKLYKAMQEDGVWNFSFELMEKCSREELNEKERLWIEMYQTDKFGYNSTKGNK
jgi:hypothetical protein